MKTLYLLRHGAAEPISSEVGDFDRQLTEKGVEQAEEAGEKMISAGLIPELTIASAADRASGTAEEVVGVLNNEDSLEITESLYSQNIEDHLEVISGCQDNDSLMLVGHMPVLGDLCEFFLGQGVNIKKGGFVVIELPIATWQDVFSLQYKVDPENVTMMHRASNA